MFIFHQMIMSELGNNFPSIIFSVINKSGVMTLHYRQLLERESQTVKQLNYLDHLISNQYDMEDEYPQLFHDDDSLFKPDGMFGENDRPVFKIDKKFQTRNKQESGTLHNQQLFQQYLDSLDINQFLRVQGQTEKNSKIQTSKSNKNLQSSLECTFKPSILKKSSMMAENLKPSFERLTMQVRVTSKKTPYKPQNKDMQKQYSKQRIERLSKPRILKTQPNQNVEYRKIQVQKKYFIPRSSNYVDVATRNQLWDEQKQLKIQKMRKQQQEAKLKKERNTFAPKLTQYRGEKLANLSNFGKQGIANYFERVNMAKSKNSVCGGKQNNNSFRKESSPYCSNNATSKTPTKQNVEAKKNQKVKYDDAVKQLHKKLMSLDI